MMDRKSFLAKELKALDKGMATVVIATLGVVDSDGDVTKAGFFGEQHAQAVGSHDWGMVPIGKARVFEQGDQALAELRFNLDTISGKDWYEAIKFDFENPPIKQQYSYGFTIKSGGSSVGEQDGRPVRFLQPLADGSPGVEVHEVSPVLLGAGINTRTLDVKSRGLTYAAEIEEAREVLEALRDRTRAVLKMREGKGQQFSQERAVALASVKRLLEELHTFAPDFDIRRGSDDEGARALIECERARFQRLTRIDSPTSPGA